MNQIERLVEQGELAREREQYEEALTRFDLALVAAGQEGDPSAAVNVIAHKLLIYKLLFNETGESLFNELMYGDTLAGMQIIEANNLSGQPQAVMLLRQGDYFISKKDHAQAVLLYGQALDLMDDKDKGQYAEYLAYYGLALVLNGKKVEGLPRIEQALSLAEQSTDLEPFHKLIVVSGMHIRFAQAYLFIKENEKAHHHLEQALLLATELSEKHEIHTRLAQVQKMQKSLFN